MPVGATLAVAGISAGVQAYGAHKAAKSADKAGTVQAASAQAALDYQKEADARMLKEYGEERTHDWEGEALDRALAEKKFEQQTGWTEEDRRMYAADRDRRIAQGAPFAALGGASASTLQSLLLNNGSGGAAFYTNQAPYKSGAVPPDRPLPPAADRETLQQMLARRNAAQTPATA